LHADEAGLFTRGTNLKQESESVMVLLLWGK
jgi:hypothetical protein